MQIAIVLGTRPEIIKLSPIIRELAQNKVSFFIIHTNQHYSSAMDKIFFDELSLPQPKYNLDIHDCNQGEMVGKMLTAIEPILLTERPDWVIVQGDTNSVLAGALCAAKLGIKVAHVEAGLRSYDRSMPEEINRILTDHLSDLLLCPTSSSAYILKAEGINKERIFVTGNTIVDAIEKNLALAQRSPLATKYHNQQYFLLTLHRPSNVDTEDSLRKVITSLESLVEALDTPIIAPLHPRTKNSLDKFGIAVDVAKIQIIEPVGYLEMLLLMQNARLILTDSGGVQEEACILKIPCITLRDNTERPETVEVGANMLVGSSSKKIVEGAKRMLGKSRDWNNPFGEGTASKLILDKITS